MDGNGFLRFTRSLALRRLFGEWCVGEALGGVTSWVRRRQLVWIDRVGLRIFSSEIRFFLNLSWVRGVEVRNWFCTRFF